MKATCLTFVLANLLDFFTTVVGLRLGSPEANPLMATLLGRSEALMWLVKGLGVGLALLVVWRFYRSYPLVLVEFAALTALVYLVVASNIVEIIGRLG